MLFHGAIGRAYISLYNPLLPLKDEIRTLTGIDVKSDILKDTKNGPSATIKTEDNGNNHQNEKS